MVYGICKFHQKSNALFGDCREIVLIPTRSHIQSREGNFSPLCPWCETNFEDNIHLFVMCDKNRRCLVETNLLSKIVHHVNYEDSFWSIFFAIWEILIVKERKKWVVGIWNIWRSRNLRYGRRPKRSLLLLFIGLTMFFSQEVKEKEGNVAHEPATRVMDSWVK